ncbi:MAG: CoA ester lyase [Pseudomonadota bacterium]
MTAEVTDAMTDPCHSDGCGARIHRSVLFCPGNHPRKLERVFSAGADAVILDLEDAVAEQEKSATRAPVLRALQKPRTCVGYVRVNGLETPFAFADLEAVVAQGVDGIFVPKIESTAQIDTVSWLITQLEARRNLVPRSILVTPILETGRGIAKAREIAAACASSGRTAMLSFGAGDYTRDMAMVWTRSEHECAAARAEVVLASRIAGLQPPLDTVWARLEDEEGLIASCRLVRDMGFQGKLCIHPAQIGPVHDVFTPDAGAIAHARAVFAAFTEAERNGSASIQLDGQFIDYPIVAAARRILAVARAAGADGPEA